MHQCHPQSGLGNADALEHPTLRSGISDVPCSLSRGEGKLKKTFAYGNVAHVKEERCVNVKISKAYSPLAGRKTRPAEGLLPSLCWC